jgi:hypothetical protein
MTNKQLGYLPDILFATLLATLVGIILGWSIAKHLQNQSCENLLEKAYAKGRHSGYIESQENGSCLKWWTETPTNGLQAARATFCKQR